MNHFLKKNFSSIIGAGGKQEKSDAPPPPVLNPPKLGALASLTSYSYSESVDALGEGPIEGLVNQNGQYLDGHRIFEGIYIDDTPVKKSIDPFSMASAHSVSLSSLMGSVTNAWFVNSSFQDKSLQTLTKQTFSYEPNRSVNDPYEATEFKVGTISAQIISGKRNISKALFAGKNYLNLIKNSATLLPEEKDLAAQKLLRFDAFSSWTSWETSFLKDYPLSTDYPFFCVRINFGSESDQANYPYQDVGSLTVNKYINTLLEHDISNQIFERFEISEIGKRRALRPLRHLDMTHLWSNGNVSKIGGSIYIFGIQENGFPTEETIASLRNKVQNIKLVSFYEEKYNYSNILAEIRNGEELQQPLGFFDKTYLDKNYGIKLLGPFSNQGQSLRVVNFGQTNKTDGVIEYLPSQSTTATTFDSQTILSEQDRSLLITQWGLEDFGFKTSRYYAEVTSFLSSKLIKSKKITKTGNNIRIHLYYYPIEGSGDYLSVVIERKAGVYSKQFYSHTLEADLQVFVVTRALIDNGSYSNKRALTAAMLVGTDIEGSLDTRAAKSYSDWSASSISQFDEEPNAVTHIVRNPNVSSVYLTMGIRALSDTAETTKVLAGTTQSVDAGSKIPSAVRFRVEIGVQDAAGVEYPPEKSLVYQVIGLADSPALIDIGRTENSNNVPTYARFIQGTENIASALTLPNVAGDGSVRYVRVTRTTHETYSSLIRREISLEKITEIIDNKFSFPNTAIAGIKLDSRTLSSLPPRSYDARLKRIMVPSNYYPLHPDGRDKRLYKTQQSFSAALKSDTLIYDGNWDGTFKEAWSDNPAWIVFDLLTNTRYGMGNYISADQINIWELYKIGRFCDAVDEDGYFYGVPSATGGLEPRYSCNIIIADKTNVFDAIKNLVSSFRGNIFYSNSYIDFTDDRVKLPSGFFNNQNVRDGLFNYTNSRRDQQYNTLEVSYFDRDDGFKVKTEYIEDPEDIKKRGVLRTDIDTFGVTSRAHANRIGKHIIYSTINENQAVSFICGPEILSCRPGDLVSVEDDLKSLKKNIGRILEIDTTQKILRLDEQFKSGDYLNEVSLFIPTGQKTYSDYYNMAVSPSKLAMNELYSNDVPQIATFKTSGYQNLDYGCYLYLNQTGENIALLDKAQAGGIYSITLSGLKQEIYKLTSVRENSPIEYEVAAIKFDTGKFGSIESGQSLVDFYHNYPNVSVPTQGSETISQNNLYQLTYPTIQSFSTGNYDQQADSIDLSGSWTAVNGATHYDYELVTPKYSFMTGRTTGLSAVFTDQTQAGRFTLKVSARNVSSVPNPISPTYSSGITVLSYSAPVRTNTVFAGINIKN